MSDTTIYGLYEANSPNEIFYIGRTRNGLSNRLKGHIRDSYRQTSIGEKIKTILNKGGEVKAFVIEDNLGWTEAHYSEKFFINYFCYLGYDLANTSMKPK